MPHKIFEFLLSLGHLTFENGHLLFFGVVDFIDLVEFLFRFDTKTLCDVKVIVCLFIIHLIGRQLLLGSVESDTDLLLIFLNIFLFDFGLLELQLEGFLLFKELLVEEVLHGGIQWVICSKIFEVIFVLWSGHDMTRVSYKI
jgi:hypothetical protein